MCMFSFNIPLCTVFKNEIKSHSKIVKVEGMKGDER